MSVEAPRFFTRSPFRSGWFLIGTAGCLVYLTCTVLLAYRHRTQISSATASMLAFVGIAVVLSWARVLAFHDSGKALLARSSDRVPEQSALAEALDLAATQVLQDFTLFVVTALTLLAVAARLLRYR